MHGVLMVCTDLIGNHGHWWTTGSRQQMHLSPPPDQTPQKKSVQHVSENRKCQRRRFTSAQLSIL